MPDVIKIADEAELIVNGYAFTKCPEDFRILNLNRPDKAFVISKEGDTLETTIGTTKQKSAAYLMQKSLRISQKPAF